MTYVPLAPTARISQAPALDDTLRYLCTTLTPMPVMLAETTLPEISTFCRNVP